MDVLIIIIVILRSFIGHIGSSYSAEKLIEQRLTLRDQYGLLPRPVITDPNGLETLLLLLYGVQRMHSI
jgi:hypothetical protein